MLPCIASNLADYRPTGVRFIFELDFAPVAPHAHDDTILKAMYYLELPQSSINLANGAGMVRSLVTFGDTADLRTLSICDLRNEVLEQGPYDGPIDLSPA